MSQSLDPQNPFTETSSAKSAADELRAAAEGKVSTVKEAATEKAGQLKEYASDKAQQLAKAASSKASAIREGAGETAANLKGVAGEQWQDTQQKAKELHASMEDSIRANPTKAVLTAAAAGFVLGLILRR